MSAVVEKEIPEGWEQVPLKDAVHIILGQSPKSSTYNVDKRGLPFFQGKTEFGDIYPTVRKWCDEPNKIAEKEDVLVSVRAPVGPTNLAPYQCAIGRGLAALRPLGGADSRYYLYLIRRYQGDLAALGTGTTFEAISGDTLKNFIVPIAPPEQQKRIVAKIEELFSHIDAGIAALNKAKQLLKQYRQSVLKAAVTGELTKQWREDNKDKLEPASQLLERILQERRQKWEAQQLEQFKAKGKVPKDDGWKGKYKERPLPSAEELPEIPSEWKWVELQHVFDVITDGDHQAPPKADEGIPFLVIGDVNKGVINFRDKRFVPRSYYEGLAEIRRPRKGDLLYTVVGSFGIPVKVESEKEFCVQRHIAILKLNENLSLDYIYHILSSGFVFKQATEVATGTAQKTVPLGGLREIKIPFMSEEEQKRICEAVNEKLDSLAKLANEIDTQLIKSEKNKQSILASSFSGDLM
jgi:type I restriction enzyme S subunit